MFCIFSVFRDNFFMNFKIDSSSILFINISGGFPIAIHIISFVNLIQEGIGHVVFLLILIIITEIVFIIHVFTLIIFCKMFI